MRPSGEGHALGRRRRPKCAAGRLFAWLCRRRRAEGAAMSGLERIKAWLGAAGAAVLVAGCAGKPAPAPIVRQAPPPRPAPPPPPPESSRPAEPEAPLTPGDWSYSGAADGSAATFGLAGAPLLTLRCDAARRQLSLSVPNPSRPLRVQ